MDFHKIGKITKANIISILSLAILGTVLAAAFAFFTPPKYEARTQLYVSASSLGGTASELAQGATYSTQIVNSYVDVAKTGIVLEPVINNLKLDLDTKELAERITVTSPQGSVLINVTAQDGDAQKAADIANSIAESLKNVVEEKLEAKQEAGPKLVSLTTTEKAVPPKNPESPKPFLDIIIGLILGLIVGFGLALIRDVLDTRVRSLEDVESVTDVPLLGGIIDDPSVEKNPLTMQVKPNSPRAESFRALRTNLQFLNLGGEPKTYVVTSANPGEGKSTTTANLALSLAEAGSRVVLIEADLRLPMIHKYLGVESGSGLTDLLVGRVERDDVIERWGRTTLYFLPAGKVPPNPSELLGSAEMKTLLTSLESDFDYVVVDTPPILSVTDAAVIGRQLSGALLAVGAGITKKHEVESAVAALDQAGVNVQGVIVTRLQQKHASQYGYGNYGYGEKIEENLDEAHA